MLSFVLFSFLACYWNCNKKVSLVELWMLQSILQRPLLSSRLPSTSIIVSLLAMWHFGTGDYKSVYLFQKLGDHNVNESHSKGELYVKLNQFYQAVVQMQQT